MTRRARVLLSAVAVLSPLVLVAAPAEAADAPGVTATPNPVAPGEPLTVAGAGLGPACASGTVRVTAGSGPEYQFGTVTDMRSAWSVTASELRLLDETVPFGVGTYAIKIDCFDDRGNQTLFTTATTFAVATPSSTAFRAVTPARLLDTRPGEATVDGQAAGGGAVGPGVVQVLKVTGRGGVAASGVGAVVLNITATNPSSPGYLTVFPTGQTRPLASSLNFAAGQTVPNLVVAKVGTDGNVSIYNDTGTTHLIADATGWFPSTAAFTALSPARLLDTRPGQPTVDGAGAGGGPVAAGSTRALQVTGRGGVPASGVGAVILNITATAPSGPGFVTAFPTGEARPLASNLNYAAAQTVANLVVAKVGAGGQVSLYNDTSTTQLIADVAGWFPSSSSYSSLSPARLLDTRPGQATVDGQGAGGGPLAGGEVRTLKVTGRGGVPATGVAAVAMNVTATGPSAAGFVTVFPTGEARPLASNLNLATGQTAANLVIAKVGQEGQVSFYSDAGSPHLIADVAGWFSG